MSIFLVDYIYYEYAWRGLLSADDIDATYGAVFERPLHHWTPTVTSAVGNVAIALIKSDNSIAQQKSICTGINVVLPALSDCRIEFYCDATVGSIASASMISRTPVLLRSLIVHTLWYLYCLPVVNSASHITICSMAT